MLFSMGAHGEEMRDPIPAESDEALAIDRVIADVLEGDVDSFRHLVDAYSGRVLAYCRARLHSEEDAQDAAQEVFLRAYKSLATFRRGENFASWLFAIAANNVRTHFKLFSARKQKEEMFKRQRMVEPGIDPGEDAERALEQSALRAAVRSLPEDMQKPVALYYFAGLSVIETAKALGIGEEAVKTGLFRARGRLRALLEPTVQPERSSRGISL